MKKLLSIILILGVYLSFAACTSTAKWTSDGQIRITQSGVEAIVNGKFETPKNVILIIGDGMGPNDLEVTSLYSEDMFEFGLVLNQIQNQGLCTTHSADSNITDSAASGTALATGVKTNNGTIAKDPQGKDLQTLTELARQNKKRVGIITNENIYGATPSAFTVHNESRDNYKEIANAFIRFKPDVLMGAKYKDFVSKLGSEELAILEKDYICAEDMASFETAAASDPEAKKSFIGFTERYASRASFNLAKSASFAFDRLKNDNGFFVMIESAGTDKFGSQKNMAGKMASVVELDRTVAAALLFMQDNPDTLLVVTSDHETGGVKKPTGDDGNLRNLFTTDYHTDTPVKVFAVGKGSEYFKDKTLDNTDIAKFLQSVIKGE